MKKLITISILSILLSACNMGALDRFVRQNVSLDSYETMSDESFLSRTSLMNGPGNWTTIIGPSIMYDGSVNGQMMAQIKEDRSQVYLHRVTVQYPDSLELNYDRVTDLMGQVIPSQNAGVKSMGCSGSVCYNMEAIDVHFQGDYETASTKHSDLYVYDASKDDVQLVSAIETSAYPGTEMHRTMVMIKNQHFEKPFILDIMKIKSDSNNQYDLPFYYMGQMITANFEYDSPTSLGPLGNKNGYQHLYLEGKGKPSTNNTKFVWLTDGKFYTLTSTANKSDELLLTRIGANDPDFNLRREAAVTIRRKATGDTTFASVIEPHGSYSPVSELSLNSNSSIANLEVLFDDDLYTAISITDVKGNEQIFILSNVNASSTAEHKITINKQDYSWTGPYLYQ